MKTSDSFTSEFSDTELHYDSYSITVDCPHCDRRESIEDRASARAWLTGHIFEMHKDKLPELGE